MEEVVKLLLTALVTLAASSAGFWAYLRARVQAKDDTTKLLMGLAYDKIISLGLSYVKRGWVTKDEYEDFRKYLYDPYVALGGNGTAERVMRALDRLEMRATHILDTPIRSTDRTGDPPSGDTYQGDDRRE